jgi:isochorismate synthase
MRAALLDAPRLAVLRARLTNQLADAPADALLSIRLDLGGGRDDWLGEGFGGDHFMYWAQPVSDDFRLGLGRALVFSSAGPARFSALQAAFAGTARSWRHDNDCEHGHAPAAFLGFAFADDAPGALADDLPNALLTVPAVLLQSRHGRRTATFSCAARDGAAALDRWRAALHPAPAASSSAAGRRQAEALAEHAWLARVRLALGEIAAGRLDKVVLSRCVRLVAERPFALPHLLSTLGARHPESTVYAVGRGTHAFLGVTPERLVSLAAGTASADALAGTAWPDTLISGTLADAKNSREQRLVVDAVHRALTPLCTRLDVPARPEVLQLHDLAHLRTRLEGSVRPGVGLFDLIARLHPTPAVGGAPAAAAGDWLRCHQERRDGWYSGGIGWIAPNGDGEVAVALRCASIAGNEATLSAGAGIVAGSEPTQELAETEVKLGVMLDALRQAEADLADARTGTK